MIFWKILQLKKCSLNLLCLNKDKKNTIVLVVCCYFLSYVDIVIHVVVVVAIVIASLPTVLTPSSLPSSLSPAIYKFALDHIPRHAAQEVYSKYISFEKQYGGRTDIEGKGKGKGKGGERGRFPFVWLLNFF